MKIISVFISLSFLWIGLTSCSEKGSFEQIVEDGTSVQPADAEIEILSFSSEEAFKDGLYSLMQANEKDEVSTKNLSVNDSRTNLTDFPELPANQSLAESPDYTERMRDYVPNESLAKLLNKDGEIIIGNTIYKITPNGTYYFSKNNKLIFDKIYSRDSSICGTLVGDKLYKIADGIFRYDTYWYMDEKYRTERESGFVTPMKANENDVISLRNYGSEPDIASFPTFPSTKENIFGFIIENIIDKNKAHTQYYDHTDKRRVRGEFYDNNHVFYAEVGAKGWTDKKNWIGWSKTEADELRVGWTNVILCAELTSNQKDDVARIKQLQQNPMFTRPEYQKIPGSTYTISTTTLVIPGLKESELKKNVNKGVKALYDYLRSIGVNQSQSDYAKSKAIAIASDTNLFFIIKDEHVVKYSEEYYCHVFNSQDKGGIALNQNSFNGNWVAIAINLAISIFNESNKQPYATLYGGKVYVAARFDNEWQGMNIYKEAK
ncbi:MAG: hypothetical protein LBS79_02155 [Tannerella sp.]|jgi:hypothetical protein|nr:hypothetical protein [Tannerella sp.]